MKGRKSKEYLELERAETGASLDEVAACANHVIENLCSMGMALTPCTVPAAGKPGFSIGEDEIEIGTGIHGEPGTARMAIKEADEVTDILLGKVLEHLHLEKNSKVAVMINGLGSTPLMELYIVNRRLAQVLKEREIIVHETFIGENMTSIEMAGCSITLLRLDEQLIELLDAKADTVVF